MTPEQEHQIGRCIFREAYDAFLIVDPEGLQVLDANPAVQRLTGFRHKQLQEKVLPDLVRQQSGELLTELIRACQTTSYLSVSEGYLLQTQRGGAVPVHITVSRIHLDPKPLALLIIRDLTERKRAEEALRKSEAELLHASRLSAMGQMAAALSHEVAQPLSAIGNFAAACDRLLASPPDDAWDALREYNRAIVKENERCREILQRLREFGGRSVRRPAHCDINDVLRDAVDLTAFDLRRHGVTVRSALAESLPPVVVDRVQLQQVVVNLLTNARDAVVHLPEAQREIVLRSRRDEEAVLFEVEDQGVGVSGDTRPRLFEPFFTTKDSGLGLGLSICQTIVQNHGGQIEACDRQPAGAIFRVRLNAAQERP